MRIGRFGAWSTLAIVVLALLTLFVVSLVSYTGIQLARFERTDARRTLFVFAAPQPLTPGLNVTSSRRSA